MKTTGVTQYIISVSLQSAQSTEMISNDSLLLLFPCFHIQMLFGKSVLGWMEAVKSLGWVIHEKHFKVYFLKERQIVDGQ